MAIRKANTGDLDPIVTLLNQLGYPGTEKFMQEKLNRLLTHPDEVLIVYEEHNKVLAVMSIHFICQLALEGDFARISYFAVDGTARSNGIGKLLEEYCAELAKNRKCDRIEVHCHERRTEAHRFYIRQGYEEVPKYFIKSLV